MEDWQDRLMHETVETAERLNNLNTFMKSETFYGLTPDEKDLLYEQQRAMSTLVQILGKRCRQHELDKQLGNKLF